MITGFLSSLLFNIARLISFLPFSWLHGISKFVAFILRKVVGYRKSVIVQNLSRSFPELKYKDISNIANAFYLHFADVFIEVIKSISLPGSNFKRRFRVENPDLLLKYYQEDRNIIALTGHIANWEWMSLIPALYHFSCYTLYKPLRNKIAEGIMTRIRHRFGMKLLAMSNAARFILSNKEGKALYIFIGDQSPHHSDTSPRLNFLNQPTSFFNGGAKLAKATQAAVVYLSIRKVKRGYYTVQFIPIEVPYYITSAEGKEVKNPEAERLIIEKYASLLEEDIKRNPVNWLWSHKRWKH